MSGNFYTPTDAFKAVFCAAFMSQREFAKEVGMSSAMVSRILSHKRLPSWDLLLKVEDAFSCEILVSVKWQD
jgi:transcriptional regulator with XRE-family HTH domain